MSIMNEEYTRAGRELRLYESELVYNCYDLLESNHSACLPLVAMIAEWSMNFDEHYE
jgi:hypothetical protein